MANKRATGGTKHSSQKTATAKTKVPETSKVTTVKAVESKSAGVGERRKPVVLAKLAGAPLLSASIAEFVGTFLLASVVLTQSNQPVALVFALVGIVLLVGGLSGAHLNPLATVGAWVTKRIEWTRGVSYLVAQVLAGMLSLVVFNAFVNQAPQADANSGFLGQSTPQLFTAPAIASHQWTLLLAELLGAAILGMVYANIMSRRRDRLTSALLLAAGYFTALVLAGTAANWVGGLAILNPASAVALQAVTFDSVWPFAIYVLTPLVGGLLGFAIYDGVAKNIREEA